MPELPEVETVVRTLENKIKFRTVKDVEVLWPKLVANVSVEEFKERLKNQQFRSFERRGKFLIFRLSTETMIVHLRMEGKFYVFEDRAEAIRHSHILFDLDQGQLQYNDVRKFGKFYLYGQDEDPAILSQLGYEPWDENLTADYLKEFCRNKTAAIKAQLLEQNMIAGIGNIYANEICYRVRINPKHPCCFISRNKWQEIIESTRVILSEAIGKGGTTIKSYTSSLGVTGLFQQELMVQSREKEECYQCHSIIRKEFVKGRGTYYCPDCQKERPLLIALTGNIGSGKSTAIKYIAGMKYPSISCDDINAELIQLETTRKQLAGIFNCKWQEVDKDLIRERIYQDENVKKEVERVLHGMIWKRIESFHGSQDSPLVFVEVPLLFETDWYRKFDCNILLSSSERNIFERLKKQRGMDDGQIWMILDSQLADEHKRKLADIVLNNDQGLSKLKQSIEKTVSNIVKLLPEDSC